MPKLTWTTAFLTLTLLINIHAQATTSCTSAYGLPPTLTARLNVTAATGRVHDGTPWVNYINYTVVYTLDKRAVADVGGLWVYTEVTTNRAGTLDRIPQTDTRLPTETELLRTALNDATARKDSMPGDVPMGDFNNLVTGPLWSQLTRPTLWLDQFPFTIPNAPPSSYSGMHTLTVRAADPVRLAYGLLGGAQIRVYFRVIDLSAVCQ